MSQLFQFIGAILILSAYLLAQLERLNQTAVSYLLMNFARSAILAVLAAVGKQWGFFLLEFVWAVVSLLGLYKRALGDQSK